MDVEALDTTADVRTAADGVAGGRLSSPADDGAADTGHAAPAREDDASTVSPPAPRGRPPAGTERTLRTVREGWKKARTAEAKGKAIAAAVRAGLLAELPLAALQWGRSAGVLTDRQYSTAVGVAAEPHPARPQPAAAPTPAPDKHQGAAPAAPAPDKHQGAAPATQSAGTQPGSTPAAPPTATTPPASSPLDAPPVGPLFMGEPAERVAMFAGVSLAVLKPLALRFKSEGFDPTKHEKGVLFRGTPLQREVDCVPVERMADLCGVLAAKRWPATGGADAAGQAKTELVVLGLAAFGPALATAAKRAVGTLWEMGRGIGGRLKTRRGA